VIDLHTHTRYSDGSLTPTELVELAAHEGLHAVAITDHDTVDGVEEALAAGRRLGVEVVPGVEINLEHGQVTMDLLGYFLAGCPTAELRAELAELRAYRDERNARILERLAELGYPIGAEELAAVAEHGAVGRPHIGEALRRHGHVTSIAEAFERFLRRGAPAWVDRRRLSLAQAVRSLRASGGLPVIAHPGIIRTDDAGLAAIARDAARLGVVGLECYYPAHDRVTVARVLGLCERLALVPTGGSDFHGDVKPANTLGVGANGEPIPDAVLDDLRCLSEPAGRERAL
jgi:predicted metal-dependent phosphoesterase TrpH